MNCGQRVAECCPLVMNCCLKEEPTPGDKVFDFIDKLRRKK